MGHPECGEGTQAQTRECTDGTNDKCTPEDKERVVSCAVAGTALPKCGAKDLENTDKDCWQHCKKTQGPCSWCGTKGMCCTTKSGWTDTRNGCDGTFGGSKFHTCALKPVEMPTETTPASGTASDCAIYDGVPHPDDNNVCCGMACGSFCGQWNCDKGPGGSSACCGGSINKSGKKCSSSVAAPCEIVQECQERTKTQNCYEIRDRGTCSISNDPRTDYAGPCGWCGDKCGNNNVCEPVKWLKKNRNTNYEDCLQPGCENSGSYSDAKCEGWKYRCDSDQSQQFLIDHCSKTCGFCRSDQDYSILFKVYDQINGWRSDERVPKIQRDLDLEKLAQSAGFITSHSQHKTQNDKAWDLARRKGWKVSGQGYVIACTSAPNGCKASSGQFKNIKTKPVTIFKDFADRTGHYEECTDPGRKYAGCSVSKKWIGDEYGYSVWCMFMG